ncbi:hypothetical protein P7C71_g1003, partial [Lecanoromycetidae sp. Uapishka_2]
MKEAPTRKADCLRKPQSTGRQQHKEANKRTQKPSGVAQPVHGTTATVNSSDSDDDGWDNWDTPKAKGATPREIDFASPIASPLTDMSSARTSLSKLSRTASTLMSEWEKSLASSTLDSADSLVNVDSKDEKAD